jgi:hypothetical protein
MSTTDNSQPIDDRFSVRVRVARAEGRAAAQPAVAAIEESAACALAARKAEHSIATGRAAARARRSVRRTWLASMFSVLAVALPMAAVGTTVPELSSAQEQALEVSGDHGALDGWLQPVSLASAEREVAREAPAEETPTPVKVTRPVRTAAPTAPTAPATTVEPPPPAQCAGTDAYDPMSFCLP